MLYGRRQRAREKEQREAAGESLWSDTFSAATRASIRHALTDAVGSDIRILQVATSARQRLLRENQVMTLSGRGDNPNDFYTYLDDCPDSEVPTVIESLIEAIVLQTLDVAYAHPPQAVFEEIIKERLAEDRVSFDIVGGEMVPFSSRELHVAVVEPVLSLLGGLASFDAVETAYRNALKEVAAGSSDDAITDAATALQETLKQLGCKGNRLDRLIESAVKKGLLASYDRLLMQGIVDWVMADRSNKGDAHAVTEPSREDAWLAIHVVGALILRLVQGGPRADAISTDTPD